MSAPPIGKAYEVVTERVLALLESGVAPWRRPFTGTAGDAANLVSGRAYHGINALLLPALAQGSRWWLTFNQARELGGTVKRGEKGAPVVFWTFLPSRKPGAAPTDVVPFLRYFTVFNLAQCEIADDALPARAREVHEPRPELEAIAACEAMLARYLPPRGPAISAGMAPCYYPVRDSVEMPRPESFLGAPERYAVLFHELAHSTGIATRLGRQVANRFGSEPYGREELVAEMTAAFLCDECGIGQAVVPNQAAYLAAWIRTIKTDPRAVVVAAGAASKAADYIRGGHTFPLPEETDDAQSA